MELKLFVKLYHAIWSSAFYRCPLQFDANNPLQIQATKQCYASSLKRRCCPDYNRYVNISTSIPTLLSAFIVWMTLTRGMVKFYFRPCECHKYWSILPGIPYYRIYSSLFQIIYYTLIIVPPFFKPPNSSRSSLVLYSLYTLTFRNLASHI